MMGKLYIVSGDDDFAVKKRAAALLKELCVVDPGDCDALDTVEGDTGKADEVLNRFLSALQTPPFLSDRQIVYLKHFAYFDALTSANQMVAEKTLAHLLGELPKEQTVLIDGGSIDMRKGGAKKLKAAAIFESFDLPKSSDRNYQADRQQLIRDMAAKNNRAITPDAVRYLGEGLPPDTGILNNEFEKLLLYTAGSPQITLQDCEMVCAHTPEAISYLFTGALVERNLKAAFKMLHSLIEQGEVEVRIMAAIGTEFQKLAQTRSAMSELGIGDRITARTFDNLPPDMKTRYPDNFLLKLHPFRAYKMCEGAVRFTPEQLSKALSAAAAANRALVSGGGNSRIVLEQLIYKICI